MANYNFKACTIDNMKRYIWSASLNFSIFILLGFLCILLSFFYDFSRYEYIGDLLKNISLITGVICVAFWTYYVFFIISKTLPAKVTKENIYFPIREPFFRKKNYKKIPLENILKVKIFNDYMFITTREKYYFSIRRKDLDDFEQFKKVLLNLLRKRTDASISDRRDIESLPEVD